MSKYSLNSRKSDFNDLANICYNESNKLREMYHKGRVMSMIAPGIVPEEFLFILIAMVLIYPVALMALRMYQDTSSGVSIEKSFEKFFAFYFIATSSFIVNLILVIYLYNTYSNKITNHTIVQVILLVVGFVLTVISSKFFWIESKE